MGTHEYSPITWPSIMMCCPRDFHAGTRKYKPSWICNKLRPAPTAKSRILDRPTDTGIPHRGICKGSWYNRYPLLAPLMPSLHWLTISPLFVLPTPARKDNWSKARDNTQIMTRNIILNANMDCDSTLRCTTSHSVADAVAVAAGGWTAAAKPRTSTKQSLLRPSPVNSILSAT
jgi:hypothetical protein